MGKRFEDLSREMARSTSRRRLLKMMGGATTAALAAAVLRPFRADAACPRGMGVCGDACCLAGVACIDRSTSTCGCPPGQQACGGVCCPPNGSCADPNRTCCCAPGLTPCGPSCCAKGVACLDSVQGVCGCPKRYTQCVTSTGEGTTVRCCPPGRACSNDCVTADTFGSASTAMSCGSCITDDDQCSSGAQCCSGVCENGDCCSPNGTSCDNGNVVCCGTCQNGICQSRNN